MDKKLEIDALSVDELGELAENLRFDIAEIKAQIERAKLDAASKRKYSDPDWFHRANYALKIKGAQHQQVCTRSAKLRKEQRRAYALEEGRQFVEAARDLLDRETFSRILGVAIDRAREWERGQA